MFIFIYLCMISARTCVRAPCSFLAPSGSPLSFLCVTLARDGSLSTVLPEPLNITHTEKHARTYRKQTNGGWQILDMNICNMTCARGERSARMCACERYQTQTHPWRRIHRKLGGDYADCVLHNAIRVICIMRLHTLHYGDYLKPQFGTCQSARAS